MAKKSVNLSLDELNSIWSLLLFEFKSRLNESCLDSLRLVV